MAGLGTEKLPRVLLVFKELEQHELATKLLRAHFQNQIDIAVVDSLQSAIELLENMSEPVKYIIFEHRGTSQIILKILIQLGGLSNFIMCTDEENPSQIFKFEGVQIEFCSHTLDPGLLGAVKKIEIADEKKRLASAELEYIKVNSELISNVSPINVDVYVRLGDGRFVKLFKKGDEVNKADVQKYQVEKGVKEFFFKKSDCQHVLNKQIEKVETIAKKEPLPEEESKKVIAASQNLVRDLVSEMGFTKEAQAVAKASVDLTLKLIGSRPKLSAILTELKNKGDGSYINSHSFMLGKIACAMAYKLGWQSATTYLKLSMSSFMHDICLHDDNIAKETSYKDAVLKQKYTAEELKTLRFHPAKASDYTRQFSEIPSDVDQIVAQHHERPDGTGFPRGITHQFISPLSSLFIIAHEMIEYSIAFPDSPIETFFELREQDFNLGQFRKIFSALKNDTKLG